MKVLTKSIGIWKLFFYCTPDGATYLVAKLIFPFSRKHVCNIDSPAIYTIGRLQPLTQDRVLA